MKPIHRPCLGGMHKNKQNTRQDTEQNNNMNNDNNWGDSNVYQFDQIFLTNRRLFSVAPLNNQLLETHQRLLKVLVSLIKQGWAFPSLILAPGMPNILYQASPNPGLVSQCHGYRYDYLFSVVQSRRWNPDNGHSGAGFSEFFSASNNTKASSVSQGRSGKELLSLTKFSINWK